MPSPIKTATAQAVLLAATSNVLAQAIASYREDLPFRLDVVPVLRFALVSLLMTPLNFLWQQYLEQCFPRNTSVRETPAAESEKRKTNGGLDGAGRERATFNLANTLKKMGLDQTIGAAVNTSLFIAFMGGLKGGNSQDIARLLRRDLWRVMKDGWKFWPAVSFVLFTAVPLRRRLLVGNLVNVLWGIYLSLVAAK